MPNFFGKAELEIPYSSYTTHYITIPWSRSATAAGANESNLFNRMVFDLALPALLAACWLCRCALIGSILLPPSLLLCGLYNRCWNHIFVVPWAVVFQPIYGMFCWWCPAFASPFASPMVGGCDDANLTFTLFWTRVAQPPTNLSVHYSDDKETGNGFLSVSLKPKRW